MMLRTAQAIYSVRTMEFVWMESIPTKTDSPEIDVRQTSMTVMETAASVEEPAKMRQLFLM